MRKLDFHFLLSLPGEIVSAAAPHSSRRGILGCVSRGVQIFSNALPRTKKLSEDCHFSIKRKHCSFKFLHEQSYCLRKWITMHGPLTLPMRMLMIFSGFGSSVRVGCEQRDERVKENSRDVIKVVMNTEHLREALRLRLSSLGWNGERARSCDCLEEGKFYLNRHSIQHLNRTSLFVRE